MRPDPFDTMRCFPFVWMRDGDACPSPVGEPCLRCGVLIDAWDLGVIMPYVTMTGTTTAVFHRSCHIEGILPERLRLDMGVLQMWVVYDHPLDFPDGFVVKTTYQFHSDMDRVYDGNKLPAPTLEAAIGLIPPGKRRIPRFADDVPAIVAVWI